MDNGLMFFFPFLSDLNSYFKEFGASNPDVDICSSLYRQQLQKSVIYRHANVNTRRSIYFCTYV